MPSKHPAFGRGVRPKACRECGALRSEGADISFRGLCMPCAGERMLLSADHLVAREGKYYEQWRTSCREWASKL